jgi:hypothetical protein
MRRVAVMYVQMTWDVGESEILRTYQLDRRSFVERIMFFAYEAGVFDSFMTYVVDVLDAGSQDDESPSIMKLHIRSWCK